MSVEQNVKIENQLGLHARAAARMVHLANQFKSEIKVIRTDTDMTADGKSILSVIFLAAPKGTEIRIAVEGEDEEPALAALMRLVADKFGEDTDVY